MQKITQKLISATVGFGSIMTPTAMVAMNATSTMATPVSQLNNGAELKKLIGVDPNAKTRVYFEVKAQKGKATLYYSEGYNYKEVPINLENSFALRTCASLFGLSSEDVLNSPNLTKFSITVNPDNTMSAQMRTYDAQGNLVSLVNA